MLAGILLLAGGCVMAVNGRAWQRIDLMGVTLLLGALGMFFLFYGLRFFIGRIVKGRRGRGRLHIFNFRQIEETVICRSHTLAVCSLLILAAMCCFGAGEAESTREIRKILKDSGLDQSFSTLFEMRVGHIQTTEDYDSAFQMDTVMKALSELPESRDREILLSNFRYTTFPYLISLRSYNELLKVAGKPELTLDSKEAAVYMDIESATAGRLDLMNKVLLEEPEIFLDQESLNLKGDVETINLITDRSITLSFALILPDERLYIIHRASMRSM